MYTIEYHQSVKDDLKNLGHVTALLVLKKIEKIAKNPMLGVELGNKANMDLSGYRKVYVDKKRVRIVYKIIDKKLQIFIVAAGKRDDMEVYQKATDRI